MLDQRERWILWMPVPVAFGIAAYFALPLEPPLMTGVILLFMAGLIFAAFRANRVFYHIWLAVFLFLLGFTAGQWRTYRIEAPILKRTGFGVTLQGRVVDAETLPKVYRVTLDNLSLLDGELGRGDVLPARVRIRLKPNDPSEPVAGDVVKIRGTLLPLSPPVMPGAFDFQRHAFFKQMGATGYALGDLSVVKPHVSDFFFENMRRYIRRHIEADVQNKENAAVITAFMVGDSAGISQKIWDICRFSGIAHLIAISGSHFMLIAGFAFFITRALLAAVPYIALRWPVKKIAAGAAMAAAIFYMMLIGAPIPAQRAVLSVCVVMAAVMLDRDPFTLRLVALSALAILLVEPESLMGASFQMSYAAVVGLVAFYESTRGWWHAQLQGKPLVARWGLYLLGCFLTTVVASLSTGPFALYHFSRMPLLAGLAANMVAVPLSSFLTFPVGLFACLLMPLGLDKWPMRLMEQSVDIILQVAGYVAKWPHAMQQSDAWPAWILVVMTLGGMWLCVWRGRMRYAGVLPIVLAALFIPHAPRPDILAVDTGKLFAVRDDAGKLWFSSKRREKFVRNEWTDMAGGSGTGFWPTVKKKDAQNADDFDDFATASFSPEPDDAPFLQCDARGDCLYREKGVTVAFLTTRDAPQARLKRACRAADIVFTVDPVKNKTLCKGGRDGHGGIRHTVLVDKWHMYDNGGYAVYLRPGQPPDIRSVKDARGKRPWTSYR
ncbi:MAG: DUF4131 domain-containing protein [Alphaproteobacteria bacterium]|nr:DUF4131 domain-containing protein [Alphaproteobacteria bacterium]